MRTEERLTISVAHNRAKHSRQTQPCALRYVGSRPHSFDTGVTGDLHVFDADLTRVLRVVAFARDKNSWQCRGYQAAYECCQRHLPRVLPVVAILKV